MCQKEAPTLRKYLKSYYVPSPPKKSICCRYFTSPKLKMGKSNYLIAKKSYKGLVLLV